MKKHNSLKRLERNTLLFGGLLTILNGCDPSCSSRTELSEVLYSEGTVTKKSYTPSEDSVSVSPQLVKIGGGFGIGANGMGVSIGGLVFSSDESEEQYNLSLKCPETTFNLSGSGEKYKLLYNQVAEGSAVKVSYRKRYEINTLGKSKVDGSILVDKKVTNYEFLDAVPQTK